MNKLKNLQWWLKKENLMRGVFFIAALVSILAVVLICVFLFAQGIPAIGRIGIMDFLLGQRWAPTAAEPAFGILPMILGSLYVTA
ncbi:MAG: phosphate ABC transporter permease subunit PstC, partial [Defluviitaleaceae bacterium]|nr:phosphate ABC transporter permease subunit PstC [Defluviitaleaceae bacterium]